MKDKLITIYRILNLVPQKDKCVGADRLLPSQAQC